MGKVLTKMILVIVSVILIAICANTCMAQTITNVGQQRGYQKTLGALTADSVFKLPFRKLLKWTYTNSTIGSTGLMQVNPNDSMPYYGYNDTAWYRLLTVRDSANFVTTLQFLDSLAQLVHKRDSNIFGSYITTSYYYAHLPSPGTGTVTNVSTGYGLTGGPITTTGTIKTDTTLIIPWNDTLPGNRNIVTPWYLASFGYGTGTVTSVNGTANRITSTGGITPIIDISSVYTGQTSITTLGSITSGTWNSTTIATTKGGTGLTAYNPGDILYASAPNVLSRLTMGSSNQVLTIVGGVPIWASPATSGTVTSITAGTGLSGGTIITSGTISMPNVGTAGTYGSATQVPIITTDAQGRISGVTNTPIATGTVTSVATDATLTGGPITSTGTLGINLATANTWTGIQTIDKNNIITTPTDGLVLGNVTAGTSGTPAQYSPSLHLFGQLWNSATSTNNQIDYRWQVQPSTGTTAQLALQKGTNNTGYTTWLTIGDLGQIGIPFSLTVGNTATFNNTVILNGINTVNNVFNFNVGKKLNIATGTNAITGTATLSSGTVSISTTAVTASSIIWVQYQSGVALSIGVGSVSTAVKASSQTAGTGFTITAYTVAGVTNATDNSPVEWWIVN